MVYGRALRGLWRLHPGVDYLNHGSFGLTPKEILAAQRRWQDVMEEEPVDFLDRRLPGLLRSAAQRLGRFLGADGEDIVFVDNATSAVNAVLSSLDLRGGEVLLASHAYPAVLNAARHRARVRLAPIPVWPHSQDEIVAAFEKRLSPRTRLAVVDHVTSPTALVLPVRKIAALCRRRGVPVLVDGAHAPGMLDLDVPSLGVDWYTGNCHKWLFTPIGCAFLWAAKRRQKGLHPAVISNNYGQGYAAEFDWCGTKDPSPWLSIGAALAFYRRLGGAKLRARNRALALAAGARLARAWGASTPPPELCGSMVALALPWRKPSQAAADRLNAALRRRGVEVPVFFRAGRLFLRVSAQAYNEPADYDRLERLLPKLSAA